MHPYLRILLLFTVALLFSPASGQDTDVRKERSRGFKKTQSFADEAVGLQTKGQLQNLTMNYGQISDTRFADVGNRPTDVFFNIRFPRQSFTGLVDDFALFFAMAENSMNGNQGNVIDGWTDNDNEDWIAKDGAYGLTHYNAATDPNPHEELRYNGQTPYLAHSDLRSTWPVDPNGVPFWPGLFRRDPQTGQQVPGEFVSDRDIYMEFTDGNNQQGNVIGLEVQMMAYSYGRIYAEDILFYELFVINKSGSQLNGCYLGLYQDPDCSDHTEEILLRRDSTYADGSTVVSIADRDFDGDIGGATRPNALGITEDYTFGTIWLETPRNLGVTDFHYYDDPGPTDDLVLWPIISSDPTNPNLVGIAGNYFHGSNTRVDDLSLITEKRDYVWISATGPFDMAPGDTVKLTVAVAAGEDDADYYSNVWLAKTLFDAKFNGPIAPPSPTLSAVAGDGRVTLYWDNTPETSLDPSSGEMDFEGYKIYRSEDGGVTWGKTITDSQGRVIGFVPRKQFDLDNNVRGPDPRNPAVWLGDNTGLQHSWVDSSVVNGIPYSYTIVAYDRGSATIFSLEGSRGDGPEVDNFVNVIPLPPPTGKVPAAVQSVTHTSGEGTGSVDFEIIDDRSLRTVPYEVRMEGTPARTFSLFRSGSTTPLYVSQPVNATDLPIVDGFRISVKTDDRIGGIKSIKDQTGRNVEGSANPSADSSWYVTVTLFAQSDTAARSASYEIRFTSTGSIAYSWGLVGSTAQYQAPFSVWNTLTGEQMCAEFQDVNVNGQWDEGETIFVTRVPYPSTPPAIGSPNPAMLAAEFAYQLKINNYAADTLRTPPVDGTIIRLESFNALRAGDSFEFTFSPVSFSASAVDLSQIRVVPNPYIVTSRYETTQNVRLLRFMYLPSECTIAVYTVSGTRVKTLNHNSDFGSLAWDLVTDWGQALAFGVYVYVVETPIGGRHVGKFALIK